MNGCSSPFQVKVAYSPQLVVYGITWGGDSTINVRVETNNRNPISDSNSETALIGLSGILSDETTGRTVQLTPSFSSGLNLLTGYLPSGPRNSLNLEITAPGYGQCNSTSVVHDSAVIFPDSWTESALRDPAGGNPDPEFLIYPSPYATAVRLTLELEYKGIDLNGHAVSGTFLVNPSYQQDTTSYFLKINGEISALTVSTSSYAPVFSEVVDSLQSGTVVAVITLLQIDGTLYDYYSIANGFDDPFTMITDKPVFTNVTGGLGFWGSARLDSISIPVYP